MHKLDILFQLAPCSYWNAMSTANCNYKTIKIHQNIGYLHHLIDIPSNRYNSKKIISILQIIPILDVVNMALSKSVVPTMKVRREEQTRNLRIREKLKESTLLGKIMIFLPLAHHQMEIKRQICAWWQGRIKNKQCKFQHLHKLWIL